MKFTKADRVKLRSYQTMAYLELRPIDESWHHKRRDAFEVGFADLMTSPSKRHQACMIGVQSDIAREEQRRDEKQSTSEHYAKHFPDSEVIERFRVYAIEHEAKRVKLEVLRSKLEATRPEDLPPDVLAHDYHEWPS